VHGPTAPQGQPAPAPTRARAVARRRPARPALGVGQDMKRRGRGERREREDAVQASAGPAPSQCRARSRAALEPPASSSRPLPHSSFESKHAPPSSPAARPFCPCPLLSPFTAWPGTRCVHWRVRPVVSERRPAPRETGESGERKKGGGARSATSCSLRHAAPGGLVPQQVSLPTPGAARGYSRPCLEPEAGMCAPHPASETAMTHTRTLSFAALLSPQHPRPPPATRAHAHL